MTKSEDTAPGDPTGPRSTVVMVRIDDRSAQAIDLLVRSGLAQSRSEAASQLIAIGIGASESLLRHARALADDVQRLRGEMIAAVKSKDVGRVKDLLDREPDLVNARADGEESPILMAVYFGADEVARLLLARGATLNLFEASAVGANRRIGEILEAEPDLVRAYSHDGWTPLHLAAFFGHREAAEVLLSRGADVGAVSRNAMANLPLHAALAGRHRDVVELLLARGANPNLADAEGYRPLHHAAHSGSLELAKLLLAHGADPSRSSDRLGTPADLARRKGHQDVADLLAGDRSTG